MRAEVVPGCGACGRREVCGVWLWCLWAARGLRGLVVVPVGGGGAWPGFEIDHSERSSCVAISRAGRRPQAQPAGSSGQVAGGWRAVRGLRGLVVVPVGGGGASPDHSQRREGGARPAGPGRASRRRAERSSRRGRRAGGQATRRPETWRGHKHRRTEKPQNSS